MPLDLSQEMAIDPGDPAYAGLLANLQGNILQSHRREHVRLLLIRFTASRDPLRNWIRNDISPMLKSAADQLAEPASPADQGGFASFFLAASGYTRLGLPAATAMPKDFIAGMAAAALGDPGSATWEEPLRCPDAMLLLADDDETRLDQSCSTVEASLAGSGSSHREAGRVKRETPPPSDGAQPVEHFGYVDGISQPRFFAADLARDDREKGGITVWNPVAPLDLVLVPDPHASESECFGSFLVFRKLEQNVAGFSQQKVLDAGILRPILVVEAAQAVGRFKNGTTVLRGAPVSGPGRLLNNFDYNRPDEGNCPVQAHVRTANLRTPADRAHRIVRRGIPYFSPTLDPDPRGILFMCYQASITDQFAFIQKRLVASGNSAFNDFITLKGGEYFFAPSLPFLRGLA